MENMVHLYKGPIGECFGRVFEKSRRFFCSGGENAKYLINGMADLGGERGGVGPVHARFPGIEVGAA